MRAKELQPLLLFGDGKDAAMFNLGHSQVVQIIIMQHRCHQTHTAVHPLLELS